MEVKVGILHISREYRGRVGNEMLAAKVEKAVSDPPLDPEDERGCRVVHCATAARCWSRRAQHRLRSTSQRGEAGRPDVGFGSG